MVRKLYHSQPSREKPGTEEWKLWSQELHFFDEVGKPGDSWHSQQIARIPYPDEDYGEPNFGTYVECATEAARNEWTRETRVDHVHATEADLDAFTRALSKYYMLTNDMFCDIIQDICKSSYIKTPELL